MAWVRVHMAEHSSRQVVQLLIIGKRLRSAADKRSFDNRLVHVTVTVPSSEAVCTPSAWTHLPLEASSTGQGMHKRLDQHWKDMLLDQAVSGKT